jgi:hypothetical protein
MRDGGGVRILPDGQISEIAVKPILKKYFGFSELELAL